jgi:hypothetical protein
MGAKRNAYRILVGKPEGKRSLGRPRRRWLDDSKMDVTDTLCVQNVGIGNATEVGTFSNYSALEV